MPLLRNSTTSYEYDNNGNYIRKFYTNANEEGIGGFERSFDTRSREISRYSINNLGKRFIQAGGFCGYTQTYDDNGNLASRTYVDINGNPVQRNDGYSKAVWKLDERGTYCIEFLNIDGDIIDTNGINLATDIRIGPDGWSEWMKPDYDKNNTGNYIGYCNLGEKKAGDVFTCTIEIEFKDVQSTPGMPFRIWTQGSVDGRYDIANVWNNKLINLNTSPHDGIYKYEKTVTIDDLTATASFFILEFRCDYWKSGLYRVKNVKIEKGATASEWTPGL